MKKQIILFYIVLFSGFSGMAQVFFGGKAGVNMGMLSQQPRIKEFDTEASFAPKLGLEIGGVAYFKVNPYFSVQLEANYARKGLKSELINYKLNKDTIINGKWNYTYDYLEIPLMFKLSLGSEGFNPFVEFGGYYGYMVYASQSSESFINGSKYNNSKRKGFDSFTEGSTLNRHEYGFKVGIGGAVTTSKGLVFFTIRYSQGLTDILKYNTGNSSVNNRVFQLSIGYLLEVRGNNTDKIYYY